MKYQIYKLKFHTAVHFGRRKLEDGEASFSADTLFSALCHEAVVQYGESGIRRLVQLAEKDQLQLSDAFPYHRETLYLPKPMVHIDGNIDGDSSEKKLYKKLEYIKWEKLDSYLKGEFPIEEELSELKSMGKKELRTNATVIDGRDAMPFSVGTYRFNEGWGLYFILGYEDEDTRTYIEALMLALELCGIGGKRSSGLGKFTLISKKLSSDFEKMLTKSATAQYYITLSTCMAKDEQLQNALNGARYTLVRKSGFVASDTYAKGFLRKKDFFMFKSGAAFLTTFSGVVEDVSVEGNHPVYRYGMPIFLEVK